MVSTDSTHSRSKQWAKQSTGVYYTDTHLHQILITSSCIPHN